MQSPQSNRNIFTTSADTHAASRCWVSLWALMLVLLLQGMTPSAARAGEHVWTVLQRAQQAALKLNYQGVLSVQSGRHMQSSRITHYYDPQHGEMELMETLQKPAMEWVRHNEDVQCIMHESKVIRLDRRSAGAAYSRLLDARPEQLTERYTLNPQESDRVAGHDALVYEIRPKDAYRYGYRLWLDRETGLLLRSQTLGDNDEVLEQVGFSELKIGNLPEKSKPRMRQVGDGWKLDDATATGQGAPTLQVQFKPGVAGFRQISGSVRKTRNATVNQYVYTDGLASVSVFIEPFDAAKGQPNSVIHHGAVKSVVRRIGDWSVTAMGEVPMITVKQFVSDIDVKKP